MQKSDYFREQAHECRVTAQHSVSRKDRAALMQLADHYEREAARNEAAARQALRYTLC